LIVFLYDESFLRFIFLIIIGFISSITYIFFCGITLTERRYIIDFMYKNKKMKVFMNFFRFTKL
jgi:hypothetical protein